MKVVLFDLGKTLEDQDVLLLSCGSQARFRGGLTGRATSCIVHDTR
jgi:hypothetical protein